MAPDGRAALSVGLRTGPWASPRPGARVLDSLCEELPETAWVLPAVGSLHVKEAAALASWNGEALTTAQVEAARETLNARILAYPELLRAGLGL